MVQQRRTARFLPKPFAHQLLAVFSPRPRWFQFSALTLVSKAQALAGVPLVGACFWGLKNKHFWLHGCGPSLCTAKNMLQTRQLKSPRADIEQWFLATIAHQRSAIVFLTPGQLAGQMHSLRIHYFGSTLHTEKIGLQHQIWAKKKGSIFGPIPCSLPYWGLVLGAADWSAKRGLRNSAFFSPFCPIISGSIWSAWPQLQRFSVCQTSFTTKGVYLLKVSLRNHNPVRSTQLLRLQAYTHTHTVYVYRDLYWVFPSHTMPWESENWLETLVPTRGFVWLFMRLGNNQRL